MSLGKRCPKRPTLTLQALTVDCSAGLLRGPMPKLYQFWCIVAVAVLVTCGEARPQEKPAPNPLAGNPGVIREGASLFRANCAPCHGFGAKGGGRGPDLTSGRWTHGS